MKLARIVGRGNGTTRFGVVQPAVDSVHFQNGAIRRAETDKKTGLEQVAPMTEPAKEALAAAPRAYEVTQLPRERWTMCHSIRRECASERKCYPFGT